MKNKTTPFEFHIPESCQQDFDSMPKLPGGRLCDQCERTVIDFQNKSDRDINRIYEKHHGRVCGIFHPSQLDKEINLSPHKRLGKNWIKSFFISTAILLSGVVSGQNNTPKEQLEETSLSFDKKPKKKTGKPKAIKGKVIDAKTKEAIPFASVTNGKWATDTDLNGFFQLMIPEHLLKVEIEIRFVGYENVTTIWTDDMSSSLDIELPPSLVPLSEIKLMTAGIVRKKPKAVPGKIHQVSDSLEIEEKHLPIITIPEIDISPNPFSETIKLSFTTQKFDAYLFHLYSESGQLLFAETRELENGAQEIHFNFNNLNLNEGIYFLRTSDSIGEIRTKRLVKVRP